MDIKELKQRSMPKTKEDDTGFSFVGCLVDQAQKDIIEKNDISHTEIIREAYKEVSEKLKKEKK